MPLGIYKIQNSQPERYQKLKIWMQILQVVVQNKFYS